ncbi:MULTISPECIES: hypothetical protein [Aurantimonas]|uniref:hypothetical protein n=1 Tax=Aurantimonas TaxID=182269 RepID=UPI0035110960
MHAMAKENPGAAEDGNRGDGNATFHDGKYPGGKRKSKTIVRAKAHLLEWPSDAKGMRDMREFWGEIASGICSKDLQGARLIPSIQNRTNIRDKVSWISSEQLAARARCSLWSVGQGLRVLEAHGLIITRTITIQTNGKITGQRREIRLAMPEGEPRTLEAMRKFLDGGTESGTVQHSANDDCPTESGTVPRTESGTVQITDSGRVPSLYPEKIHPEYSTLKKSADAPSDDLFEREVFNGCGSFESYERDAEALGSWMQSLKRGASCNARPCYDNVHGTGSFARLPEGERARLKGLALAAITARFADALKAVDLTEGVAA